MAEIHLDFLNFNSLLILLLLFLISGYLYYEIHKLKIVMNEIQYKLDTINRDGEIPLNYVSEVPEVSEVSEVSEVPEVNIEDKIQGEDINWNHIHQQMNEDDKSESSESSKSSESKDYKVVNPFDMKDRPSDADTILSVNNSANIDEILAGKNIITDNSLSDILNVDSDLTKIDEFINTIKENESKVISTDYDKMTVSQLKKILSDKELPVSGNKTKLIERIKENSE
jgi:hypothetical protein